MKYKYIGIITSILAMSCSRDSSDSRAFEFVRPTVQSTSYVAGKLGHSPDIPHRFIKRNVASGNYFFDSDFHNVEFSTLTEQQFSTLRERYGSWSLSKSEVTYKTGQVYYLSDFLPPLMQATQGTIFPFQSVTRKLPRLTAGGIEASSFEVSLYSNCWGTAYEIIRQAQNARTDFTLFYAPHALIRDFLHSPTWSDVVKPFSKEKSDYADARVRNSGLKTGDVLLVGDEYLQHVAIYIDEDLFFEKAGSGPSALYRLNTYAVMEKTWDPTLFGWSYRRFGKTSIPEPRGLFSLEQSVKGSAAFDSFSEEDRLQLSMEIPPNEDPLTSRDVAYFMPLHIKLEKDVQSGKFQLPRSVFSRDSIRNTLESEPRQW